MVRLLIIALLAASTVAIPPGFYSKPQTRVALPDGRRLNLACLGEGAPTVVLNQGLGLPGMAWSKLQPILAADHKVCAIDRPGYGFSDPGPMPRTAVRSADDIHAALRAAGLRPPFILVGHSRGGFDVRQFAHRYPRETAGLVLIDVNPGVSRPAGAARPNTEAFVRDECVVATAEGRMRPGQPDYAACGSPPMDSDIVSIDKARAALSEADNIDADDAAVARIRSYGRIPMMVLTADVRTKGTSPDRVEADQADINRAHQTLAAQSKRGRWRYVEGASHVMMFDRPDVVAQAVADVSAQFRAR
jgi:pimeloyl-ACP methyl ester carboxylesterase